MGESSVSCFANFLPLGSSPGPGAGGVGVAVRVVVVMVVVVVVVVVLAGGSGATAGAWGATSLELVSFPEVLLWGRGGGSES